MRIVRPAAIAAACAACAATLFLAMPAAAQEPDAGADDLAALCAEVDHVMATYADQGVFHGVAMVAVDGEPLCKTTSGLADIEWGVANTTDTRFRIGALTHLVTAILVMQDVEDGRVGLQTPIAQYLPEYAGPQADRITVEQLLIHTSGIPDFVNSPEDAIRFARPGWTQAAVIEEIARLPLSSDPGTLHAYSNSGYLLLGAITERVAGAPWCEVVQERVLTPAGMIDTGCDEHAQLLPKRARSYVQASRGVERAPYEWTSFAEGVLYSTAPDLVRLDAALRAGSVLSLEAQEVMARPFVRDDWLSEDQAGEHFQGYGLTTHFLRTPEGEDVRVLSNAGGIGGFAATMHRVPDDGLVVVVLNNVRIRPVYPDLFNVLYGAGPASGHVHSP